MCMPPLSKAVPEVQGWAFMWVPGVQAVFREPFGLSRVLEDELKPSFELPPDMWDDMIPQFLVKKKWLEKLKNWHSGVQDDGLWCLGCSTLFFTAEELRNHILRKHHVKMFITTLKMRNLNPCQRCSVTSARALLEPKVI